MDIKEELNSCVSGFKSYEIHGAKSLNSPLILRLLILLHLFVSQHLFCPSENSCHHPSSGPTRSFERSYGQCRGCFPSHRACSTQRLLSGHDLPPTRSSSHWLSTGSDNAQHGGKQAALLDWQRRSSQAYLFSSS